VHSIEELKKIEMNYERRRLSSSSINNGSNMRLEGAMEIPLQVQVSTCCVVYLMARRRLVLPAELGPMTRMLWPVLT
jgi:hypothetical protein